MGKFVEESMDEDSFEENSSDEEVKVKFRVIFEIKLIILN